MFKWNIPRTGNKKQYKKSVDGMFSTTSCQSQKRIISPRGNEKNSRWEKIRTVKQDFFSIVRNIRYKKIYTAVLAVVMIFAIVFKDVPSIYGATYYWNQLDWSGGQTTDSAAHPGNQNAWNEFSAKDSFTGVVNGGADVQINWSAGTSMQTSDNGLEDTHNAGGFNAGTKTNTKVDGVSADAKVKLAFEGVSSVSAGDYHTVAIRSDNSVWAWGANGSGQLGDSTNTQRYSPVQVVGPGDSGYLQGVEAVSSGNNFTLALKSDGTVWAWGDNSNGQLGNNSLSSINTPVQAVGPDGVGFLNNIIAISAGNNFSLALKSDGTVWAWGKNNKGQLGNDSVTDSAMPIQVLGNAGVGNINGVAAIDAGGEFSVALKSDGSVWTWGSNGAGQLGRNDLVDALNPTQVKDASGAGFLTAILKITAGVGHVLALKTDGTVFSWGLNDQGQLGINSYINKSLPVPVQDFGGAGFLSGVLNISAGSRTSFAVKADRTSFGWGWNNFGQLGNVSLLNQVLPKQTVGIDGTGVLTDIIMLASGESHSTAFKADGTIVSWGRNNFGQLGNDRNNDAGYPIRVIGPAMGVLAGAIQVASGYGHSLALKADGTVWAWGWNGYGQIGDGTTVSRFTPVQVKGEGGMGYLSGVKAIAAGFAHSMALLNDGTIVTWGWGAYGQLGYSNAGGYVDKYYPVHVIDSSGVGNLSNVLKLATGDTHSMAIKTDGTLWAWGNNSFGQIGDNTTDNRFIPLQVHGENNIGNIANIVDVSGGSSHTVAVNADGSVWAWGKNDVGQLGINTRQDSLTPVQVLNEAALPSLGSVASIACGESFTMALSSDGQYLWGWGNNNNGQLGQGTTNESLLPVRVKGAAGVGYLTDVAMIRAGSSHAIALMSDGSVSDWGGGIFGQLGNNIIQNQSTPVKLLNSSGSSEMSGVGYVAGGYASSFALPIDSSVVWSFGNNNTGQLGNNRIKSVALPITTWDNAQGNLNVGHTFYYGAGSFISAVIDSGNIKTLEAVDYSISLPSQTDIMVDVRAGNSANAEDGSWSSWMNGISSGADISSLGTNRYLQFRVNMLTTDTNVTPIFNDISFNYQYFPSPAQLTSSAYNTSDGANILAKIKWNESLQAGTDVHFQVRTAPDNGGVPGAWTAWMGPDGTSGSAFADENGGEAMPAAVKDGIGDQWIQYQAILLSDGLETPTLHDVTMQYVVNAPPEVQNVVVFQDSDGIVQVDYQVRDSDTTFPSNVTPGEVIMDLQYCTANCTVAGSEVWASATTINGNVGTGIVVEELNWSAYHLTWNAKTDYPEIYNSATDFKVRVRANDSEGANNMGYGQSNVFELDTKNPTGVSFSIDNNANKLQLTTPVDNTAYQMLVSNYADFRDASYQAFSAEYDYPALAADPATVYMRIKDAYGNYTSAMETTPAKLSNVVFYDISNNSTGEYRELISWEVAGAMEVGAGFAKYNIWRSTDGVNYLLVNSITDKNVNYYLDKNLSGAITYYYKVTVEDIHSNIAEFSDIVSDMPDGQGGLNSTPPIISNVSQPPVAVTSNSATLTWDTDKLANSTVGYSTVAGNYDTEVGNASLTVAGHSVVLTGLTHSTTYYFRVKSADIDDNVGTNDNSGVGFVFTTLTADIIPPVITNESVSNLSSRSASINWNTDEAATSFVEYSVTSGFPSGTVNGTYELETNHAVILPNVLAPDTTYYYKIHTKDASGNENISNEMSFRTLSLGDVNAPVISGVAPTAITHNSATIGWMTDEPATSYVEYGTTSSYGGIFGVESLVGGATPHSIAIPNNLLPETDYHYRVRSKDAAGNEALSDDYTFKTLVDPQDITAPVLISGPTISGVTATSATIVWMTDELSSSRVGYSQSAGNFTAEQGSGTLTTTHSVTVVDLLPEAHYYYQIKSADPSGNVLTVDNGGAGFEFTTNAGQAPVISAINATKNAYNDFTIAWATDLDSDSFVEYGTTASYGSVVGNYAAVKNHAINLQGLLPATTYYYRVRSAGGFEAVSGQYSFVTGVVPPPPMITAVTTSVVSYNTATVTWTTDLDANSYVEYGADTNYGRTYGSGTLTKNHSITLPADLAAETVYHFRVHSTDIAKSEGVSGDVSFQTIASPVPGIPAITSVTANPISSDVATINWITDVAANSYVEYGADTSYARAYGSNTLTKNHSVLLPADLTAGTTYYFRVKSADVNNNLGMEDNGGVGFTFTTLAVDTTPPSITGEAVNNLTTKSAAINWMTSEPATSFVEYSTISGFTAGIVTGTYDLSTTHAVTIPNVLSPDSTYFYKIHSKDALGNEAISHEASFHTLSLGDIAAPVISNITASSITHKSAEINWSTSEPATSYVEYGITNSYGGVYGSESLVVNHAVTIPSNLIPDTDYHYRVRTKDAAGNEAFSDDYTFKTLADPQDITPPTLSNGPTISGITATAATVTWTTNEPADSTVGYSQSAGNFQIEQGDGTMTILHTLTLVALLPDTHYFYQIKSADPSGNLLTVDNSGVGFEFTTSAGQAPVISAINATKNAYNDFTIAWATDLDSDSFVEFGTTASYGSVVGNYAAVKNHAINLQGLLPATTYYYRVRSAGEFEAVSGQNSFVTEVAPVATIPTISNVQVSPISYNTATITWNTDIASDSQIAYGLDANYGRVYGNYVLVTSHSVTLPTDLAMNTTYHFSVHSTDTNHNERVDGDYSFKTTFAPVAVLPVVTGVAFKDVTPNAATIIWNTDVAANSYVEYGTSVTYGRTYGSFAAVKNHSVTLPADLTPDTIYHFRVHSTDAANNEGLSGDYSFRTTVAPDTTKPSISNVKHSNLGEATVSITWQTNENASSIVYLGTSTNYTLISGDENAATQDHAVNVTGLVPATTYHFQVMSRDGSGNASYSSDGVFTTLALVGAPQISSGPTEELVMDTNAHIVWTTDQNADSKVVYGKNDAELTSSLLIQEQVLEHDTLLTGLTADADYFYKVISVNAGAIAVESAVKSFTTAQDPAYVHAPLGPIENPAVNPKANSATVTFQTDQDAKCDVEYRIDQQEYSTYSEGDLNENTNHNITLSMLNAKTKYFLKITCTDNLDNTVKYPNPPAADDFSFVTGDTTADGEISADTTSPSISGIKIDKASVGDGTLVSWSTDELSSSFVRYGLMDVLGNVAGDDLVSFDMTKFVTSHAVIINNLTSNTKYFYSIVSTDTSGNIAQSAVSTFSTSAEANLSSIKIEATSLKEVAVSWSTGTATSSVVEFGTSTAYGQARQDSTLVKEHQLTISNLVSATTYHLRVRSKDEDGKEYVSSDYTFIPKAPPAISGVNVTDVNEHGATVSFTTNVATDAVVEYTDVNNPKNAGSQGSPEFLTTHSVVLHDITPGTTFAMRIKVRDETGSEVEQLAANFTTNKDETAPKIDQVRIENALTQNDKVQTIISWITDEDTTAEVVYRESKDGKNSDIPTSDGNSQNHIVVNTNLKPGIVYFFNVKSTDKYGNEAISETHATLTPKRKENIIQIIINNFQEIFKWTNA